MKMSQLEFAAATLALCTDYRCSVTSWIRTVTHNHAVGGVTNSLHISGLAADLVLDNPLDRPRLMIAARAAGLDVVDEHTHIHIEADPKTPPPKG